MQKKNEKYVDANENFNIFQIQFHNFQIRE